VCLADIEANVIARGTVGFTGADLENLVNQAALKAAVDGKDMVTLKELEFAKDKILMGEMSSSQGPAGPKANPRRPRTTPGFCPF